MAILLSCPITTHILQSVNTNQVGSIHRYSMPSAGLGSQIRPNTSNFPNSSLESFNAAKFLFNDEDRATLKEEDRIPTPDIKSYLKLTDPDDKFPTLSRRDDSGLVSLLVADRNKIVFVANNTCSCQQTQTL